MKIKKILINTLLLIPALLVMGFIAMIFYELLFNRGEVYGIAFAWILGFFMLWKINPISYFTKKNINGRER